MLTGFNTDVPYGAVTLHVQTEDKGSSNPLIETLVYLGGRILDRESSDYRELLENGGGSAAVIQLMERQHRQAIARVRKGELDEKLLAMGVLESDLEGVEEPAADEPEAEEPARAPESATPGPADPPPPLDPDPTPLETPTPPAPEPTDRSSGGAVLESGEVAAKTLDQVILDYLSAEADEERLVLVMEAADEIRPGREAVLRFQTRTALADEPVEAADVRVRMITTSAEPLGLARGETDNSGRLELKVRIPELAAGAAALIINARSRVGDAELKHLI